MAGIEGGRTGVEDCLALDAGDHCLHEAAAAVPAANPLQVFGVDPIDTLLILTGDTDVEIAGGVALAE